MTLWQRILSWLGLYKPDPVVLPKPDPVEQPKLPIVVPLPEPLPPAAWKDDNSWQDEEKYVSL